MPRHPCCYPSYDCLECGLGHCGDVTRPIHARLRRLLHSTGLQHAIVAGCGFHECDENVRDLGDQPHEGLHGLHLLLHAFLRCKASKAIGKEPPLAFFREAPAGNLAGVLPAYLASRIQGLLDDSRDAVACKGKDSRKSGQKEDDQEACMLLVDRTFLGVEHA